MGMFDKPQYLTGSDGFVSEGDEFWIHNARLDGTTTVGGTEREQVKMQVSREREGEKVIVYTSGAGIVGQVKRMDKTDRDAMPMHVRLDTLPATQPGRSGTNVLTPANAPAPTGADAFGADIPF